MLAAMTETANVDALALALVTNEKESAGMRKRKGVADDAIARACGGAEALTRGGWASLSECARE